MKRNRFLKLVSTALLGGALTIGLSSCAGNAAYQNNGEFRLNNPTKLLDENNSPLNNGFNNSPISTYAQSELLGLTTYQTVGNFTYNADGSIASTPSDLLLLEGAKAAFVFKDESTKNLFDTAIQAKVANFDLSKEGTLSDEEYTQVLNALGSGTLATQDTTTTSLTEGIDYWVFTRDQGALQFQEGVGVPSKDFTDPDVTINYKTDYYNGAISDGTVYQFIIDTDNQWVDGNGNQQGAVSSKDFERTIEAYTLASDLSYNRNGYFLSLLGLDFDKTCGYTTNNTVDYNNTDGSRDWTKFDISNYQSMNNSVFTFYIDTAYPYTFGLLSKEYFNAIPHDNQKVKNIDLKLDYIATVDNLGKAIDESATQWQNLYGSGAIGQFTDGTWYAGAYRISSFTSDTIVMDLNSVYLETAGKNLLDPNTGSKTVTSTEKKINRIYYIYGSGTTDTYYEQFKSKQNDYLAAVPSDKTSEAAKLFTNNGLVLQKIVQTTQSNYIAYTPNPYIVSADGSTVTVNSNIDQTTANFEYQWNSKNSYLIRAGISGLVNWYQLSLINLNSGDFQLSATPYGVFSDYYENVAAGNLYGGLPRPWSDYKDSPNDTLSEFKLAYYNYGATGSDGTSKTVAVEELTINQQTFQDALKQVGATTDNPLNYSIKFGEGSFSANYSAELNRMKSVIETLSGGLISVTINQRDSSNPTAVEWYNTQSSPLGFSYWAPDYNGVGTWIEADTTLQTSTKQDGTVISEAVPGTNAHNAWITFLSTMVASVKATGATLPSTTASGTVGLYSLPSQYAGSEQTNLFDSDARVTKGLSKESLAAMGITLKTDYDASVAEAKVEDAALSDKITAGQRYAILGVGLLNTLIGEDVFDGTKFQAYVDDPSKLLYQTTAPTNVSQLYVGNDIIKSGQSEAFSKWVGVYAGNSSLNALFENNVLDSDYSYVPRSESGLNEVIYSLVNPNYVARAGTQSTNYRDFGWKASE